MDGYTILAGLLIFFFLFIYLTWFGFSVKIENEKEQTSEIKINNSGIVEIEGVKKLKTTTHRIMSDRIVAGTYIIAAVMLNKKFEVKDIDSVYLKALTD